MDKAEGSPVITSRPASRSWFPKVAIAFFAVIFLVLGVEGYYYWKIFRAKSENSAVKLENESVVEPKSIQSEENPLIFEVTQEDGSVEKNIVGVVKEINRNTASMMMENEEREQEIFVTESTRFVPMSRRNENGEIPNTTGLEGFALLSEGMGINVYLFKEEAGKITAEAVLIN